MKDFSTAKEIQDYKTSPKAMYVGAPGKCGYLRMGFELDSNGKSIMRDWERHAPLIVQQELYFDEGMPEMPCVYILSSGGPNVDGDRYEQIFKVKKDAYAFISTGASTKIAEMRYNYSAMTQTIELEENAYLEYLPEPIIPCKRSRFISDTELVIDPTASLFYSEIFMGGRKYYKTGELFQYDLLSIATYGRRPDETPLFREKFLIRPSTIPPQNIGIMDKYDVFANILILTPKKHADKIYEGIKPFIDKQKQLALGVTTLPNDAGLSVKILGMEAGPVKKLVRSICAAVRMEVKNKPFPAEFPWR